MESLELRQTTDAIQRPSCLMCVTKGPTFCECGVCLHPDDDIIRKIKARFKASIALYHAAKVNRSRCKKHGMETTNGKKTIGKPWTPKEERRSAIIPMYWNDGKRMRNTAFLKWQLFGQKRIAVMWTILRRLTSAMKQSYSQGSRYESKINMQSADSNLQAGPMKKRRLSIGDEGIDGNSSYGTGKTKFNSFLR